VLIIVPTVNLVSQLAKDFEEYSTINKWNAKKNCHQIFSGQVKYTDKRVIISTWQSLSKVPQSWYTQIKPEMVIID